MRNVFPRRLKILLTNTRNSSCCLLCNYLGAKIRGRFLEIRERSGRDQGTSFFDPFLIKDQEDIGSTIKHLAVMYAMYYNQKYSRSGHLFQDRFKSEPVNDMAYFVTLLRYIHQNPTKTKAGMVSKVGDYDWSSWKEYTGEVPGALGLETGGRVPVS